MSARPLCPVCGETYFRTMGPNAQDEKFYEHKTSWKSFCTSGRNDENERKRQTRGSLR